MRYEPESGRVLVSTNPPRVPKPDGAKSVDPSGAAMEIDADEQHEVPIVTPAMSRLTRSPSTPSKVSRALSPGVETVTVTGSPPGTIGGAAVADPETVRESDAPPAVAVATRSTAPAAGGV